LYSAGGGGVVLEHQYGATLLAALLTGDPLPELGDDVTPMMVRFQASAVSAVDDPLISGRTPDGGVRQVSVGVRRVPKLVKSEAKSAQGQGKSVRLIASYLKVIAGAWEEILAGRWRRWPRPITGHHQQTSRCVVALRCRRTRIPAESRPLV
jgi:hypothetical protein